MRSLRLLLAWGLLSTLACMQESQRNEHEQLDRQGQQVSSLQITIAMPKGEAQALQGYKFSLADDVAILSSALIEVVVGGATRYSVILPVQGDAFSATVTGRAVVPVVQEALTLRVSLRDGSAQTRFIGSTTLSELAAGAQTVDIVVEPIATLVGTTGSGATQLHFVQTLTSELLNLAAGAEHAVFEFSLSPSSSGSPIFSAQPTLSAGTLSYTHSADMSGYIGQSLVVSLLLKDGTTVLASGSSPAFTLGSGTEQVLPQIALSRSTATLGLGVAVSGQGNLDISIDVSAMLASLGDWRIASYALDISGATTNKSGIPLSLIGTTLRGVATSVGLEALTFTLKLKREDGSVATTATSLLSLATLGNSTVFQFPMLLNLIQALSLKGVLGLGVYDSFSNAPLAAVVNITGPETYLGLNTTNAGSLIQNLAAGTYTVSVSKSGYNDTSTALSLASGEVKNVSIPLTSQATVFSCSSLNTVAYWSFDSGHVTASTATDRVGGNTGSIVGTPEQVGGKVGNALRFDGISEGINVGNASRFNFGSGNFSIAAWVNTEGSTIPIGGFVILSRYGGSPFYDLMLNSGSLPRFSMRDAQDDQVAALATLGAASGWHFVVGVRQGTTALTYVDGQLSGSASNSLVGSLDSSCLYTRIAGGNSGAENCTSTAILHGMYKGMLDEIAVFSRSLSASEVSQLYVAGNQGRSYCQ